MINGTYGGYMVKFTALALELTENKSVPQF